ncbi:MAG TPA: amino acid permease, partial [Chitinophagaceae bacterium]|nr:amino acid permease [Chitinophagaceae bacterium]
VVSTIIKLAVIAGLVIGIFYSGNGSIENFVSAENPKEGGSLVRAIVIAMTGAFFAYDGWINVNFIAGEIKNPQKNIPKSLFTGVMLCVVVYLFVNQAYLYVLPVEKIASSQLVAADAMQVAFNGTVSAVVAAMIVICTFGAINGNIMATCRVTYSMGRDKVFAPSTGKIHQRFQTPGNALWLHAIWTSVLVVSGSFDMLADMFVFITWISYGIGAAGIFLLRKKMPDLPRPYKIWGYPWMPVLFMGFCIFYLAITLWSDVTNYLDHKQPVINSLLGLALVVLGIPFYFYYQKKAKKTN